MSRSKKLLLVSTILGGLVSQAWAQGNTPSGPVSRSITVGKGAAVNSGGDGATSPHNIMNTSPLTDWSPCSASASVLYSVNCIQAHTPPLPVPLPTGQNPGEFPLVVSLYSDQPLPNNPVAGYFDTWAASGSAQAWAINPIVHCAPGASGCIGDETDVNNYDCDPGPIGSANGACPYAFLGKLITGVAGYNLGSAIAISAVGPPATGWHQGISSVGLGVIKDAMIYENDGATRGWNMLGPHALGLDFSGATFSNAAIFLPVGSNGSIVWNNTGGHSSINTDTSGNVIITSPANTYFASPVIFDNTTASSYPALSNDAYGNLTLGGTGTIPSLVLNGGLTSQSGKVTFYNSLSGVSTNFSVSGLQVGFNRAGLGESDFLSGPGTGVGGFEWDMINSSGNLGLTGIMTLTNSGALAVKSSITAMSYSAGSTPTAGVTCSGTPTSSFATVNGIVTHC